MFVGIAAVVEEYAEQKSVGPPVGDVEREIAPDRGEASWLHDVGENICANLGRPIAQLTQAPRRDVDGDGGDQERHHQARGQQGTE